jgi:hypothetical protein
MSFSDIAVAAKKRAKTQKVLIKQSFKLYQLADMHLACASGIEGCR